MTPEEIAHAVVAASCFDNSVNDTLTAQRPELETKIAAAIREAVEEEREGCARVCDAKEIERRLVSEAMGPAPKPGTRRGHGKDSAFVIEKAGRLGGESVAAQLAAAIRSRSAQDKGEGR